MGVLAIITGFFAIGLTRDPHALPTMMIDRPMPDFKLEPLGDEIPLLTFSDVKGEVTLVNVFGSWCVACAAEHSELMKIGNSGAVTLYGVDWRDTAFEGRQWLEQYGNPYSKVGLDADSRLAINLGVTGAPESFLIDTEGRIRYKHIGPITPEVWQETFLPLIQEIEGGKQ
ncbi:DsbE family thiol:disulfide interchange protein [Hyphomonas sp.]|uniref:DsbE family thiol:disulfide interchange protein n=1 Tax=Hyphomonas sp. TaxID=87 RepID=UPI0035274435